MSNSQGFLVARRETRSQGYTIDYKCLALAYLIEACVVSTSLIGAWLLAERYGHDGSSVLMMMLAPVAFACVELARVPLAFCMRTQTSVVWKLFFGLMVVAAAGVTVKSLSQLGEMMFRPRLYDVMTAATTLEDARSAKATVDREIAAADARVAQTQAALAAAETRLKQANSEMGALPRAQCGMVSGADKRGVRYRRQVCSQDPRVAAMTQNLVDAQGARGQAALAVQGAQTARGALEHDTVDRQASQAEGALRDAVMQSQLHSFTAMVFGKDPTAVTDAEIHSFLRIFVFFPAVFASLAATALAIASVNYDPVEPASAALDERAADYFLGPLAEVVTAQVLAAVDRRAPVEPVTPNDKIVALRPGAHA